MSPRTTKRTPLHVARTSRKKETRCSCGATFGSPFELRRHLRMQGWQEVRP
jgi:hypothetical protein